MATTIRLLGRYKEFPRNSIVTLDDATAAALLTGGVNATTDLTGGVPTATPSVLPSPPPRPAAVNINAVGLGQNVDSRRPATLLVAGTSLAAFAESTITLDTLVDNGDGTVTATKASGAGLQLGAGQQCRINVAPTRRLNAMDAYVVSAPNVNTAIIKLSERTHTVTGTGQANLILPGRRTSRGWLPWMESRLRTTFRTTWCAVGGATCAQIVDLLRSTRMEDNRVADQGIVEGGMNDIYGKGYDTPTSIAEVKVLVDEMRLRCHRLTVMSIPPRSSLLNTGSADPIWSAAKLATHLAVNDWLESYARQIGAAFFDTWGATQAGATYVNPASPAGAANPDVTFAVDPTHNSARGAQAWGFGLADTMASYTPVSRKSAAHKLQLGADANNLLTNSDMSASTGGMATGFIASGATTGISVAASMEARTVAANGDANGNNQVLDLAYGTVASGLAQWKYRRDNVHTLLAPYVGQVVQLRFPYSVTGSVGLQAIELEMIGTTSTGETWRVYGGGLDGNLRAVPGDYDGELRTPPVVVPPGLVTCSIWANFILDSTQVSPVRARLWQPKLGPVAI